MGADLWCEFECMPPDSLRPRGSLSQCGVTLPRVGFLVPGQKPERRPGVSVSCRVNKPLRGPHLQQRRGDLAEDREDGARRIGGGGVRSNASDLARFLIAHSNGGQYGGTQVLTPESVELMHSPRMSVQADLGMVASGYGWAIYQGEPRYYWGSRFDYYGVEGHGGSR